MKILKIAFCLLTLNTGFSIAPAHAQEYRGIWFSGITVSNDLSGYAGVLMALDKSGLGHGMAMRISVNGGRYRYDTNGTLIKANYGGGEVAAVYQMSSADWGWANFSIGPRYGYTAFSPNDPANERQGSRWDAGLGTDGALDLEHWRLSWLGAYGIGDNTFQTQLQVGRKLSQTTMRMGLEGRIMGDRTYTKNMLGGFFATAVVKDMELLISAGTMMQSGQGTRPYAALEISQLF
jgi:hypothetical protein